MSAQMLEVSLLGVGTVLRLERDAWSMLKWLRQEKNECAASSFPPSWPPGSLTGRTSYDYAHTKLVRSTAVRRCPPQKRALWFPCTDWLTSPCWPWYKLVPRGVADLYPSWGHAHSNTRDRSITHSLQILRMSFTESFDVTAVCT